MLRMIVAMILGTQGSYPLISYEKENIFWSDFKGVTQEKLIAGRESKELRSGRDGR